ncbi:ribosome-associated translation inhibitor RaiA [Candidatus Saganbacteria bacterium]|nr:ribosome-associated translation inhibitor RaiA [Candidatus Saganbacteria bacterium]
MEINIQGHGMELTEALRNYAFKKVSKLQEFFNNIQKAQVILDARNLDEFKRSQVCEVNMWLAGKKVIRASEAGQDMYASIDMVCAELEQQIKKHKEKHVKEVRRSAEKEKQFRRQAEPAPLATGPVVVKSKRFNITTMTREEALLEMQKLGHEFFLFRDAESGNINVVHGDTIIRPEAAQTFSEDEALKHLNGGEFGFLAFLNSATNEMNVLYKRRSGNFGLIEPAA